jgi:hypothetical protein
MKDQNDDHFNEESHDPVPNNQPEDDNFDHDDLSQFDDIHEEYEDTEELDDQAAAQDIDEDSEISEEDAYASLEGTSSAKGAKQGAGLISMIKENWLYLSLGAAVIIIAIYLIMGIFSPNTPAARPAAPTAAAPIQNGFNNLPAAGQQTATAPSGNGTATNTGATTAQPNANATAAASPGDQTTISMSATQMQQLLQGFTGTVQQSMKSIQDTIQESGAPATNEKLSALQGQLSTLNGNISTLNSNLNMADTRLTTTQQQLSQVLAQESANQQKLTLRAVVPGRAWLVDGNGNTISVTVGSDLGYIGTVTEIDSDTDNTQVITSSGYIFK